MKEFKKRSIFTQQLYDRLSRMQPGETITYQELEDLIGMPVQSHLSTAGYGYLGTARNMCLNENQLVFRPITDKGLECLEDHKLSDVWYSTIGSLRRKATKGIKEVSSVKNNHEND